MAPSFVLVIFALTFVWSVSGKYVNEQFQGEWSKKARPLFTKKYSLQNGVACLLQTPWRLYINLDSDVRCSPTTGKSAAGIPGCVQVEEV